MDKGWLQAMNMSALCTNLHRACIIAVTAMVASPTAQAADTPLTAHGAGVRTVAAAGALQGRVVGLLAVG
jgi:hypothetical protein